MKRMRRWLLPSLLLAALLAGAPAGARAAAGVAGQLRGDSAPAQAGGLLREVREAGEAWEQVLQVEDPGDPLVERFAREHPGELLMLEGSVACVSYGEAETILLIHAGDYTDPLRGPDFQVISPFEEPVYLANSWSEIQEGNNITLLARLEGRDPESGMLLLKPESVWYRSGATVEFLLEEEYHSPEMIRDLQTALNRAGFDCGEPDGLVGGKTREAASAFRKSRNLGEGTAINAELAAYLRVPLKPEYTDEVQTFPSETAEVGSTLRQVLSAAFRGESLEGIWDMGRDGRTQATEFASLSTGEILAQVGGLFTTDQYRSGVLASISLAQFILESDSGRSELSQLANNLFGIKCSASGNNWSGSTWDGVSYCRKQTREHTGGGTITIMADFRYYACVEDSIADHSAYLVNSMNGSRNRYPGLRGCRDYKTAAAILQYGGYATSPTYASDLCRLIERYNLTEYDLKEN